MDKVVVDAKGMLCPRPLIMTKKALKDCAVGQTMAVIIDNEASKQNVLRFLRDNGAQASVEERDGVFTLTISKERDGLAHPDAQAYCTPAPAAAPHVILFRDNVMGGGDPELGSILIKAFVNTIKEVSPLPGSLVFYNRGIFLALRDSPVLEALRELESHGVTLLVCGTCTDYYDKKEAVAAGVISNMYTILETLTGASHIVEP
jgi:selenium metabolism protein YedF